MKKVKYHVETQYFAFLSMAGVEMQHFAFPSFVTKSTFIFLICLSTISMAQVKNAKYEFLLNRMLSRSVPIISIAKASMETDALFLDAREPQEYNVSHINNALLVGYDHFDANLLKNYPKNKKIVVYCSMGVRSEKIGEKLLKLGYTNVQNLYGGLFEWVNESKPIFDQKAQPTNKVHAYGRLWGVWLDKGEKVY